MSKWLPAKCCHNKCSLFHYVFHNAIVNNIPIEKVLCTPRDKPWITLYVKSLINKRWRAYRTRNFNLYNHYKHKVKTEIERARSSWMHKMNGTGSQIWNAVHTILGDRPNCTDPMSKLYSTFSSIPEAANCINTHLVSHFSNCTEFIGPHPNNDAVWDCNITVEQVYEKLTLLVANKATGSDLVPPILYKLSAAFIAEPLCHIFNVSIATKCVPNLWKIGHVSCIPKATVPTLDDIRPITLLATPSKIF